MRTKFNHSNYILEDVDKKPLLHDDFSDIFPEQSKEHIKDEVLFALENTMAAITILFNKQNLPFAIVDSEEKVHKFNNVSQFTDEASSIFSPLFHNKDKQAVLVFNLNNLTSKYESVSQEELLKSFSGSPANKYVKRLIKVSEKDNGAAMVQIIILPNPDIDYGFIFKTILNVATGKKEDAEQNVDYIRLLNSK